MQLQTNGVDTFWDEVGREAPLVLIHNLGLNADVWLPIALQLAPEWRCILYDLRGHGRSSVPAGPYSLEAMAEDLRGLLDGLDISRASLAGLSLGGMVAMTFATRYPERVDTLTLVDTTCGLTPEARQSYEARADQAEREGLEGIARAAAERWFTPAFLTLNRAVADRYLETLRHTDPGGYAAAIRAIAAVDLCEVIAALRCPTLILVGAEDAATPPSEARRLHETIPASELHVIPNAAHLAVVEQPDLIAATMLRFLRRAARCT